LAFMQMEVDEVYTQFVDRVANGRKMTAAKVQLVARGRVWTGEDAKKAGLVDAVGGMTASINALTKLTRIKDVVFYPKKEESTFNTFLTLLDEELENEKNSSRVEFPTDMLAIYEKLAQIKKINGLQMRLPFIFHFY